MIFENLQIREESCYESIKRWFLGPKIAISQRIISLNGNIMPKNYFSNLVKNQKYSMITFVPSVLYNQFKFFSNMFFLIVAISQFIPALKIGLIFAYVAPLVFVLTLTMLKEAYDDYKRYKSDKLANSFIYEVVTEQGLIEVTAENLAVGDIVLVKTNQRIPADLILLQTKEKSGAVFIKTDQLDGETDWKLRKAIKYTQDRLKDEDYSYLLSINASITANKPIEDIYEFEGVFQTDDRKVVESLNLENTLWANTVLASGKIVAIVAYTGKETRMAMNSKVPRSKVGLLEIELNFLSKLLFVFMTTLSIVLVFLNGFQADLITLIVFTRYFLLLSSIIPISMRVNLDFAKILYSYKINMDQDIKGTVARNSDIPEDLGRVQFLLTDKTGTLTQNEMIFRRLSNEKYQFSNESKNEIQRLLKKSCERSDENINDNSRFKETQVRDFVNAIAICHNVTPVVDNGVKVFQAASPDEISLGIQYRQIEVKTAEEFGVYLKYRDQNQMVIVNAAQKEEEYEILENFPFSSETKRMGILVRHVASKKLIFYLKGADVIMKNKVPEFTRGYILDECENMAREGLRTLVIAQKVWNENDYSTWKKNYEKAKSSLENRKQLINKQIEVIEQNMDFLCITGVEDKLQEDVCQTLENIRNAGIQVWMLTGDKIETAICIAISAGIKDKEHQIFLLKEFDDEIELQQKLNEFQMVAGNSTLVIDGQTLKLAMEKLEALFFQVSTLAPSVVCCRCSPTQKSAVTECIKKFTKKQTAAIGDGGNDVGMIQSADIGIGIVGKEGLQAALASDFSIMQFKYLNKLLLWHGRLSYKRSAILSQFVMHRGLVISVLQVIFTSVFYYVSIPIYNGMLILGYSTIFTMLPVFSIIFDEDVDVETALKYPPLYKTLQKGRELNFKTFCLWTWKSLYQGAVIMMMSLYLFDKSFLSIVTITFSALIFTEFLNIYSELHSIHIVMIISQITSIIIYISSMFILKDSFDVKIIDQEFVLNVLIIVGLSWLPLHLANVIIRYFQPTDHQRIMKGVKKRQKIHTSII